MSRLLPLILVALAVLEGAAAGPYWFWKKADGLIALQAVRRKQLQTEQTARAKGWDFWTVAIDNLTAELKGEKARIRQQADDGIHNRRSVSLPGAGLDYEGDRRAGRPRHMHSCD